MEILQLVDPIVRVFAVFGGLGSLALLVKTMIELSTGSTVRARSEYDFVNSFAQQMADPVLSSYAEELALKTIIGGADLTTTQRRALLTLPNRVRSIPKYLKAHRLLTVHPSGHVLRWKLKRHKARWYRRAIMTTLHFLYVALALVGFTAFFGPYPKTFSPIIDAMLRFPPMVSLYFLFLASWCLFSAIMLSTAEYLVEEVEAVGPFVR